MHGAEIFLILLVAWVFLYPLHTLHKLQVLQVFSRYGTLLKSYLEEEYIGLLLVPHVPLHHGGFVQLLAGTRCW